MLQCSTVYEPDDQQFRALGYRILGRYDTHEAQAILSYDPVTRQTDLVFAGTRLSDGSPEEALGDLLRDLDCKALDLGNGVLVACGAYRGAKPVYDWALTLDRPTPTINVKGHSLGGWQASYAPLYWPAETLGQITTFGSPKPGNEAFFHAHAPAFERLVTVVNGRDPWFGYPPKILSVLNHGPLPLIWLHGGKAHQITEAQWPGGDLLWHFRDHTPSAILAALRSLTAVAA